MKRKSVSLVVAVAGANFASVIASMPASAYSVKVNGATWDLTTYTTFGSCSPEYCFYSQPWWGDESLAIEFAAAVSYNMGGPNPLILPLGGTLHESMGPLFVYDYDQDRDFGGGIIGADVSAAYIFEKNVVESGIGTWGGYIAGPYVLEYTYAKADLLSMSAVPEPLTILGSITAAAFGVAFKRKKNSNKEE